MELYLYILSSDAYMHLLLRSTVAGKAKLMISFGPDLEHKSQNTDFELGRKRISPLEVLEACAFFTNCSILSFAFFYLYVRSFITL